MNIIIIGSGSFATAMANQLSINQKNSILMLVRNEAVVDEININHTNNTYFPNKFLNEQIKATTEYEFLKDADVVFIALPTKVIIKTFKKISEFINPSSLIVNLSKGIYKNGLTINEALKKYVNSNNIISFKGPTFAVEIFDNNPSMFTLAFKEASQYLVIKEITSGTNIYFDYTSDTKGIEYLSAIKNIYAIFLGIIDAKYNSANTRFMILTKAISEIRIILDELGGREETLFLSAGIGDLGLTGLNDLSRNRTLGLLIGKGFYNKDFNKNSVVLEGIKALKKISKTLSDTAKTKTPIFNLLKSYLDQESGLGSINFDKLFSKGFSTVITYGTFDLFHYGHMEILRRAKQYGDRLIVGLSTDEFNLEKGKECRISYADRKQLLESIDFVDFVVPEDSWDQKLDDVIKYQADVFVMGDDWQGKFDFLKENCEVVYLKRTVGISTTKLKSILGED